MNYNIEISEPFFKKPKLFQHKLEEVQTPSTSSSTEVRKDDLYELEREFSRDEISKLNIDYTNLGEILGLDKDNPFNYMSQSEIYKEYLAQKLARQEELKLLNHSSANKDKKDQEKTENKDETEKVISNEEYALIELQKASLEMNTLIELTSLLKSSTNFSLVTSFEANYDSDRQPILPPLQKLEIIDNYFSKSASILKHEFKELKKNQKKKRKNLMILNELKKLGWNVFSISRSNKEETLNRPYETMKDYLVVDCSYYPTISGASSINTISTKTKKKSYIPLAFSSSGLIIQESSSQTPSSINHNTIEISIFNLKTNETLVSQNAWDYFEQQFLDEKYLESMQISDHSKVLDKTLKEKRHEAFAVLIFDQLMQECLNNASKFYSNLYNDPTKINELINHIQKEEKSKNDFESITEEYENNNFSSLFNFNSNYLSNLSTLLTSNDPIYQSIRLIDYSKNSIKLLLSSSLVLSIDLVEINQLKKENISNSLNHSIFSNILNYLFDLSKRYIDDNLISSMDSPNDNKLNQKINMEQSSLLILRYLSTIQYQILRSRLHHSLLFFKKTIKSWCQLPNNSVEIIYKRNEQVDDKSIVNFCQEFTLTNDKEENHIAIDYFQQDLDILNQIPLVSSDFFTKFNSFSYYILFYKLNFSIKLTYNQNNNIQIHYNNINTISSSNFQSELSVTSSAVNSIVTSNASTLHTLIYNKNQIYNNTKSLLLKITLISLQYFIYNKMLPWCRLRNLSCRLANSFLTFFLYNSLPISSNHIATILVFVGKLSKKNNNEEYEEKIIFEIKLHSNDQKINNRLKNQVLSDSVESVIFGQTTLDNYKNSSDHFYINL